jgi:polysaccharide chain length determinant protein (PEP-CTERM system associated)
MATEVKNLYELLEIVKRRKRLIAVTAGSLFIVAAVIAFAIPSKYRSVSTILIEDQEIPRDYVAPTVTGYADQRIQTINQRIMSTPKLLEIINRFNLYSNLKATWTTEEIINRMREDIKFQTISADVIDPRTGNPRPATIAFTLSYEGRDPAITQQVATVLASLYLEENLRVREQQTIGTSKFFEDEMNKVKASLDTVESRIAAFKQQNINALPELAQLNYQEMDRVDRDIDQLNVQLRSLREREGYLQTQLAAIPTDAANQDKTHLNELRVLLGNLRSRVTENYPDVKKTKLEIAELEARIRTAGKDGLGAKPDNPAYITLDSQLASTRSEIDSVKRQVAVLEKKRGNYGHRIEAAPRVEEGYKALLVERNNLQLKYDDLSKKFMEAKVAHGLEREQKGEKFTIIDAARMPEKPFSPNIPAILLIGAILGLGAGAGAASLREHGDHSARSVEMLAKGTGFPVLAAIPMMVTAEDLIRRSNMRKVLLMGSAAVIVVGLLIVHFLVMDLDILWAKLLLRLSI